MKLIYLAALIIGLGIRPAYSDEHPSNRYPTNVPPSVQLHYRIQAERSGLTLLGEANMNWQLADAPHTKTTQQTYSITNETYAAIFGKILEASSHGVIDTFGLAPEQYQEKTRNKSALKTSFNRQTKQITFSDSTQTYPLKGGEQDRTSIIWQLVSIARAAAKSFTLKSEWRFFVAGQRDAEQWIFTVDELVTLKTALGEIATVHLVRKPLPDAKNQHLDIWLAPSLAWCPVRIKFIDADGNTIDQSLDQIKGID
jgi:hypothetical protein